jgi:DNA-binding response OmpR family regulator
MVPTVLLVEDDRSLHELLATVLRADGYAVAEAWSGGEAIAVIEQHWQEGRPLDAMLLDLMLPDMDGLRVRRHLHENAIPLREVMMSASSTLLAEAMRLGANVGFAKPFDLNEILALVAYYCAPAAY